LLRAVSFEADQAALVLLDPDVAVVPIVAVHGAHVPWGKVVTQGVPVVAARRLPGRLRQLLRGPLRGVSRPVPTSVGEAYGEDVFVTWGTVHGTMDGTWLGIGPTHSSFTCAFVNVVPFRNGKMQGEQLFFDLPALCRGAGVSIDEVLKRAAAARQP
jgi:hypothetical protein